MKAKSVTRTGQVTIPVELRRHLGIRQGSRMEFSVVDDHLEMRAATSPFDDASSGFGMLKSKRAAVPADFNSAMLLKPQ
ncbi:MAG: AbrB/MazE/SpoVT family DNA-binding domain-containing protein [Burkholderiales bacterium]